MLSEREAFKVGFLSRCVEEGVPLEDAHTLVKQASEKLAGVTDLAGKVVDLGKPVIGNVLGYGIPLGLAAPPVLGGIGGYMAGKLTDVDDRDVGEMRKRELVDAYRRHTDKLRREKEQRERQSQQPRRGRVLL